MRVACLTKDPGVRARAAAATAVSSVVHAGRSLDPALADAGGDVPASEQSLYKALTYGVLRHWWSLEARLKPFLKRRLKRRDRHITALLKVGALQIDRLRIPAHASVSQTVEAARLLGRPQLAGLVNGVLRNLIRGGDPEPPSTESARFDHPDWMLRRIRADWPDDFEDILAAGNRQAPMWLRVNPRMVGTNDYRHRLPEGAEPLDGLPQALRLAAPVDATGLPGFAEGHASVQDAAAQLAAPWLLGERPSEPGTDLRLLDLCAAPGGKAAHLLELAGQKATLTALEVDPARGALIDQTLDRLGLSATVSIADASRLDQWWNGQPFDRVLLDAPCSASGVIRRHPDIKHLRREDDLAALSALQDQLLDAAWQVLAPGGRLLYVTCSVFAAENDAAVGRLLKRQPDAVENKVLPNNNIKALMKPKPVGFQVLPGTRGLDGFFYACLDKRA